MTNKSPLWSVARQPHLSGIMRDNELIAFGMLGSGNEDCMRKVNLRKHFIF